MAQSNAPKAADYETVCDGDAAAIRLAPKACKAYRKAIEKTDKISLQRKTHLGRYFREFCDHMDFHTRLNPQQFKREDTLKDGVGGEVGIWTFKGPKWRVYGAILVVNGKRCFVGTRVDSNKKQDKADQAMLRATAKDIGNLAEYRAK
jgi:hypothetical protein